MKNHQRQYIKKRRGRCRQKAWARRNLIMGPGIVILLLVLYALITKPAETDRLAENDSNVVSKAEVNAIEPEQDDFAQKLKNFAEKNHFSVNAYPEELIELLQKNPETEEFVLNYPLRKNEFSTESLTELLGKDSVPLLMQWDKRWGYYQYGDNVIGLTGCGPTCLSMVAIHLLQNAQLTPIYMADYSTRNGYCVSGSGTAWEFMSRGAEGLGLEAREVPLNENTVKRHLREGNPIICVVGPGEFTDNGHFIVFTGLKNDKIVINDPNSRERSEKMWEFEDIKSQIRNMWVYKKN